MSKQMKLECCLFSIDLNQLITAVVFFHWLKLRFFAIVLVIRSRIFLLTLPPGPRGVVESAHRTHRERLQNKIQKPHLIIPPR